MIPIECMFYCFFGGEIFSVIFILESSLKIWNNWTVSKVLQANISDIYEN